MIWLDPAGHGAASKCCWLAYFRGADDGGSLPLAAIVIMHVPPPSNWLLTKVTETDDGADYQRISKPNFIISK